MTEHTNRDRLRELLRALPRTKITDSRYPIDAYEDDLVALFDQQLNNWITENITSDYEHEITSTTNIHRDRGLEYMNSWLNILKRMEYAVEDAKKDLEAYEEQKTNNLINIIAQVGKDGNS